VTVEATAQPLAVRRHSASGPVSSLAIPGRSIQIPRNPTAARVTEIAMIQRMIAGLVRGAGAAFPVGPACPTGPAPVSWFNASSGPNFIASGTRRAETIARQRLLTINVEQETSGRVAELQRSMLSWHPNVEAKPQAALGDKSAINKDITERPAERPPAEPGAVTDSHAKMHRRSTRHARGAPALNLPGESTRSIRPLLRNKKS
jgi:hypothetical protein